MSRCLAAMFILTLATACQADGWKAGVAKVSITPETPIWMAGYAARTEPSTGKLHDLWAKALVVEDGGGNRAALVTLDLCGIDRDLSNRIRDGIEARTGLARAQIALACSHTHSGPVVGVNLLGMYPLDDEQQTRVREYSEKLSDQVVQVVEEAVDAIGSASVTWSSGRCDFAVNRRNNDQGRADELRAEIALKGPVDHDVPVLAVKDESDHLVAIVFGYACHCTTLDINELNGDYAGFAQIALEKSHPGAQAMFFAGCGADQNPLPRRSVELAENYGAQLAAAVERVLSGSVPTVAGRLAVEYEEIDLAFAEIPDKAHWEAAANSDGLAERNRAKAMLHTLAEHGSIPDTYPYPVQVWRLGDGPLWVLLGGEVTVDYALRLKGNLGSSLTWVAAYVNDVMAYIPSLRVLQEGGYEGGGAMVYYGQPAPWSDRVEEHIISAVRELVDAANGE